MSKKILCMIFFLVLWAWVFSMPQPKHKCLTICKPNKPSFKVCVQDLNQFKCTRMRTCQLQELNCHRRVVGLPEFQMAYDHLCESIAVNETTALCNVIKAKHFQGKGNKTSIPEIFPLECYITVCKDDNYNRCWRSPDNQCRLMTRCQAVIENCLMDKWRQVFKQTKYQYCENIPHGVGVKKCTA